MADDHAGVRAITELRDRIMLGDALHALRRVPDASVDASVSDPPYGLGTRQPNAAEIDGYLAGTSTLNTGGDIAGRDWSIPPVAVWREVHRILKPGGLVAAFAGTRTLDLMAAGIEAAGFNYVGCLQWIYSSGLPKSFNISKAIDRLKGAQRKVMGRAKGVHTDNTESLGKFNGEYDVTEPATPEAKRFEGWGTSLKPAWEPVLVFSKGETDWRMPPIPFLYCSKPNRRERTCDGRVKNNHVTVKPVRLMRWLVRQIVPTHGLILEPYAGSGTTLLAALLEERHYIAVERDDHYREIAHARVRCFREGWRPERHPARRGARTGARSTVGASRPDLGAASRPVP